MKRLHGSVSSAIAAGFIGFTTFGSGALAEQASQERIVNALTAQPKVMSFGDRLRLARSRTFNDRDYTVPSTQSMGADRDYAVAIAQSKPAVDLAVYFEYNSAVITPEAELQLRQLGHALTDPQLRGLTFSINGHTTTAEGDGFNNKLSERRAVMIKGYLVDNFQLPAANLRTVGYGKTRPKNKMNPNAPENGRVEIVNESTSVASGQSIDLEVYFDFNSAMITAKAEPQLRELGAALLDPRLKGLTFSIDAHTNAVEGDGDRKLSERRALTIREYLVDNFQLSAASLHTIGYGKTRPKNKMDVNAPENRRIEIVNLGPQAQGAQ